MPPKKYAWLDQIKSVEREFRAVSFATRRLLAEVQRDPTILQAGPELRDLRSAAELVEGTYVIRLFAEFETGLRSYRSAISPHFSPAICCAEPKSLAGFVAECVSILSV